MVQQSCAEFAGMSMPRPDRVVAPHRLERVLHWLALLAAFLFLGSLVLFAEIRPDAKQGPAMPSRPVANPF